MYFDKSQQPLIKQYKQYRKISLESNNRMFEDFLDDKVLLKIVKTLGIKINAGRQLILESDIELEYIQDFFIFEYLIDGNNCIQRYQEQNPDLEKEERAIISAKLSAYTSFFKIVKVEPTQATLTLKDFFVSDREVKIIDINLSHAIDEGKSIFTRILPFADLNMTSGMAFIFPEIAEKILLKKAKILMQKIKSDSESIQKFAAFFKLNRTDGLEMMTRDV